MVLTSLRAMISAVLEREHELVRLSKRMTATALGRPHRVHRALEDFVGAEAVLVHQIRTDFVDPEDQCRFCLQQETSLKRCR
jgi:hypothetical protein